MTALQTLLAAVSGGNLEACIVLGDDGDYLDVVPIKLKRYESCKLQVYNSFNQALDEFYLRVITAEKAFASVEVDKLKKEAERLRRMVAEQEKSIHEDEAKSERDKLVGDTIYAHFNELQTFQEQPDKSKPTRTRLGHNHHNGHGCKENRQSASGLC